MDLANPLELGEINNGIGWGFIGLLQGLVQSIDWR
jgi:hypothetical protein